MSEIDKNTEFKYQIPEEQEKVLIAFTPKKHSKLYYWFVNKREVIRLIFKGRFFIEKSISDDNKNHLSSWYLNPIVNNWSNRGFIWELKPKVSYSFLWGFILVRKYRKKEHDHNISYGLVTTGDYGFINAIQNGAVQDLRKDAELQPEKHECK